MDDLISRAAVLEALGEPHPMDYNACSVVRIVKDTPSVPAVPLDKLCEWLQDNASLTYGTLISAAGWKYELTRWMEGLDGTD